MELTPVDDQDFQLNNVCHICGGYQYTDKNYKVRDHDHVTGRYRGVAHRDCNLNFQLSKNIPVVFHNLRGYDGHIIMQNIGQFANEEYQIEVIPNSMEKYMTFFLGKHLRFIDSYQFMNFSLDILAKNLKDYPFVASEFDDYELLTEKGVYPYEYTDSFERFNERQFPSIEKFK